ncbi:murein biosynthesis integral membrane protein MurJ [Fictibacillus nanhaiensis]|uniref:murein biosynthesis integral membrane protein MurJ n=1 Tax=Fictibacillus nanhaiensis TaxID=742169 RepID=UPI001C98DDC5|nr:murein biosynthesis integral membrane protein MurJ [Fictibacillus nanhaiensis]MBY6037096.1 murein biosynthesis integral membrane protein MurJ [Fictibacillus nanhaiensis]
MGVNLFKAGAIVFVVATFSKILGFLRETFVAYHFGTSHESDAYYLALTPSTLAITFSLSLSSVFLPLFIKYLKKKEEAYHFANKILLISLITSFILYGVVLVFSEEAIALIAPGLTYETEKLSIYLLQILFPLTFIVLAIQMYTVMLNSFDSFFIPAISILPNNIVILIYLTFFVDIFGVSGLAFVTLVAFIIQLIILVFTIMKYDYTFQTSSFILDKRIKDFSILLLPILLSTAFSQLNAIVDRALASTQSEGSIAALMYSYRLKTLIAGIFITAVITVTFPKLSRIKNKTKELVELTQNSLLSILVLIGPLSVFFIIFHTEIIRVLFERGAFDQQATLVTSNVFLYYSIGLVFMGYREILSRNFFAAGDTKTPTKLMIISLIITMIMSVVFVRIMGIPGLGLSSSLGLIINATMISFSVNQVTKGIWSKAFFESSFKIIISILCSGIILWFCNETIEDVKNSSIITQITLLVGLFLIQCISFLFFMYILKIKIVLDNINSIKRKFVKER